MTIMNSFKNLNLNSLNKNKEEALGEMDMKQIKILLTNLYNEFFDYGFDHHFNKEYKEKIDEMKKNIDDVIEIINNHNDFDIEPTYFSYRALSRKTLETLENLRDYERVEYKLETLLGMISLIATVESLLFNIKYNISVIYVNMVYLPLSESDRDDNEEHGINYPKAIEKMVRELVTKVYFDAISLHLDIENIKSLRSILDVWEEDGSDLLDEELMGYAVKKIISFYLEKVDEYIEEHDKLIKNGFCLFDEPNDHCNETFDIMNGKIFNDHVVKIELTEKDKRNFGINN